ncbi:MAG: histidine phosphatase family protein [Oscillospiraceae bacterium]|nr:histidine phosphatase family protein [Oscillospiraceae bacterium]
MRVWLIRHGMTANGEQGRYQGRLDDALSEAGRAALRAADFSPAHVYVSPARRARETAAILFPGAERRVVPALREMDFGLFEGRSWREMEKDAAYRAWVDGGCVGRCPNGEDKAVYTARVNAAFSAILARERGNAELVIVAHGGTQMALLESRGEPARAYWQWQRPCGCGWLLEAEADGSLRVLEEVGFLR